MRKIILGLGATMFLAACQSTPIPQPKLPEPVKDTYHPSWPVPVQPCSVKWETFNIEGAPYVAVSYEDNLTLAICLKDVQRYILELKQVTCQYRRLLSEPQCKETNDSSTQ